MCPIKTLFDFTEGRKEENYYRITRPEERHGLDGVVNGIFLMQDQFHIIVVSQSTDVDVIKTIVNSLPNPDKWERIIIE